MTLPEHAATDLEALVAHPSPAGFKAAWGARQHRTLVSKITPGDLRGYLSRNAPAGKSRAYVYEMRDGEARHLETYELRPRETGGREIAPAVHLSIGMTPAPILLIIMIGKKTQQLLSVQLIHAHASPSDGTEARKHSG